MSPPNVPIQAGQRTLSMTGVAEPLDPEQPVLPAMGDSEAKLEGKLAPQSPSGSTCTPTSQHSSEDWAGIEDDGENEQPHKTRPRLLGGHPLSSTIRWYKPPRRKYTRRELLADRTVNFGGAGFAWIGAPLMAYISWNMGDSLAKQLGFWTFGLGMMTMLTCSAVYHHLCWRWDISQGLLGLDHIGISTMIMGAYVPVMQMVGAWKTLAVALTLGVLGLLLEAYKFISKNNKTSMSRFNAIRYLVMGWACLPAVPSMWVTLPRLALIYYFFGGITYSTGIAAFMHDMEFHQSIWHAAVVFATFWFYMGNMQLVGLPLPW